MNKLCLRCAETKAEEGFHRHRRRPDGRQDYCKECLSRYYQTHRSERADFSRRYRLNSKHGLTEDERAALGSQCDVCGSLSPGGRWQSFHIDHDHSCCPEQRSCARCRRGILCNSCNTALDRLVANHEHPLHWSAVTYLARHEVRRLAGV